MRRLALLGLILLLPACQAPGNYVGNPFAGFGGFMGDTVSLHLNPNRPVVASENMTRVMGQSVETEPLLPEAGNIWPGPAKPDPTLQDIEREQNQGSVPPLDTTTPPTSNATPATRGSSTPPAPVQGNTVRPAPVSPPPAAPMAAAPPVSLAPLPSGAVVVTPQGQAVITNGGNGHQLYTMPIGGTGRVINNGNGTVTLIGADGTVQSVPAPR